MNEQNQYVVVGRVCGGEDDLRYVTASSQEEACLKFEKYIRTRESEHDPDVEVFIEFCLSKESLDSVALT